MSKSNIEWTEVTWNPTTGCDKITAGCKFCYAEVLTKRLKAMGQPKYQNGFNITLHEAELKRPYGWRKPCMVFVNSMSDLFHKEVPLEFIQRVFETMNETPLITYQVLTKRAERLAELSQFLNWTDNIWMGVSVEDEKVMDRIGYLKLTQAKIKFLSLEPLIGPLPNLNLDGIEWVICGGESGPGRRPIDPQWAREIRDSCFTSNVPFFMKQMDKKIPIPDDLMIREFPQTNNSNNQLNNQKITTMKTTTEIQTKQAILAKLSPFKKEIGQALINGENPESLAIRLAEKRVMPVPTAQAYITMVRKLFDKVETLPAKMETIVTQKNNVVAKNVRTKISDVKDVAVDVEEGEITTIKFEITINLKKSK
ncbi:DUF5131 family protein [Aurantibacillus circumpalustris]|uniref:DUF5131 family protein n=1 Tax=Aurantibacillus circumpalustris TaxID=3036359 RepID=UPI00295B8C71|nr:phage Gp37/Gp68 family protein [Aurantibacillus circumpalustris]